MSITWLPRPHLEISAEECERLKINWLAWDTHEWIETIEGVLECKRCNRGWGYAQGIGSDMNPSELKCLGGDEFGSWTFRTRKITRSSESSAKLEERILERPSRI